MPPAYAFVATPVLDVGYLEWNPAGRRTAVLLHGWPDGPAGWSDVADRLAGAGWRVLCPALRGFAPTRFRDPRTPRSGQLAALGRDLLDFVDALGLDRPLLVGHDWGARAAANACGLRPAAAAGLAMLSVGYGTNAPDQTLPLPQARNYWYHWYMATERGAEALARDRRGFARYLWETWSPPAWRRDAAFEAAAPAFDGPDWLQVVVHSYRHRWGLAEGDPAYAADEARLQPAPSLDLPALLLHGEADTCNDPATSAGSARWFAGPYARRLLPGVGHFPQHEAPDAVADALLEAFGDAR
ncbi:alpha/beta hydrolase [Luteimonas sp. Y-2-2-4F]|nr:alpha/beta hydrolase [Luteimonas sp. Y-2-2-4F]MCD9032779.1 alpha/beta hydrolase [Luteimonas sp. Y-2-2-4F]